MSIVDWLFAWRRDRREEKQDVRDDRRELREERREIADFMSLAVQLAPSESEQTELKKRIAPVLDALLIQVESETLNVGYRAVNHVPVLTQGDQLSNADDLVVVAQELHDSHEHLAALKILDWVATESEEDIPGFLRLRTNLLAGLGRQEEALAMLEDWQVRPKQQIRALTLKCGVLCSIDRVSEGQP